ncbi:uncharacterized protein LOC124374075 [Homalodisca vitripennis]|uniref:uncharacterized protein LOC124374075 n=1 Tax=Homalodisca vitripennis TaxID=197043 RepID=UPI001EEB074E|nr:uncharacterized protein LOC124374075 [Homalodisca vitripennis]
MYVQVSIPPHSYQERDKVLRSTATGSRYRQYMTFLNEMYVQVSIPPHSYQERDKVLRSTATGSRYRQYMTFLNEMYVQLKRSQLQLKTQYDGVPPQIMLLTLLSKCFIDCLQAKPLSKIEIEAIFFILTSIGKDLEHDLPKMMSQVFFNIRDVFHDASVGRPDQEHPVAADRAPSVQVADARVRCHVLLPGLALTQDTRSTTPLPSLGCTILSTTTRDLSFC